MCNAYDDSCGMMVNVLQQNIGIEFEYNLCEVSPANHTPFPASSSHRSSCLVTTNCTDHMR